MIWLLHGNVGVESDWDAVRHELGVAHGVKSRTIDLWKYAHGYNDLDCVGCKIAEYIAKRDKNPIICGYSLGGRIAMHAVLAQPTLFRMAVFVSTHFGLNDKNERIWRMLEDENWAQKCEANFDSFYAEWQSLPLFGENREPLVQEGVHSRLEVMRSYTEELVFAFRRWSLCHQDYLLDKLAVVPTSQLWVVGERDTKFTALAKQAVGDAAVIIPAAGHRVIADASLALARVIATCLR